MMQGPSIRSLQTQIEEKGEKGDQDEGRRDGKETQ